MKIQPRFGHILLPVPRDKDDHSKIIRDVFVQMETASEVARHYIHDGPLLAHDGSYFYVVTGQDTVRLQQHIHHRGNRSISEATASFLRLEEDQVEIVDVHRSRALKSTLSDRIMKLLNRPLWEEGRSSLKESLVRNGLLA